MEITANAVQTVAENSNVLFTNTSVAGSSCIVYREGSGLVTLRGLTNGPSHPKLIRSDGSVSIGACDDDTKTIYISYETPRHKLKKVLCHEITHAAMFSYNVDLSIQQEEILADLIATYGQEIVGITNCLNNRIRGTS